MAETNGDPITQTHKPWQQLTLIYIAMITFPIHVAIRTLCVILTFAFITSRTRAKPHVLEKAA